mmetsp:Transcript_8481/g.17176  ORF Transcript_8481/g.17176 Transcript_8481/m.17176 type:complete len:203 (-) Transcript_8481:72-680(-)
MSAVVPSDMMPCSILPTASSSTPVGVHGTTKSEEAGQSSKMCGAAGRGVNARTVATTPAASRSEPLGLPDDAPSMYRLLPSSSTALTATARSRPPLLAPIGAAFGAVFEAEAFSAAILVHVSKLMCFAEMPYFLSHSAAHSGRPPTTTPVDIHTSGARCLHPRKAAFSLTKAVHSSGITGCRMHSTPLSELMSVSARYSACA